MPTAYTQGYQPHVFADFSGGLNLRDKADAVGDKEAIDLLNVTFSDRGAIRQRDGYADLTSADLTNRVDSLAAFYNAAGLRQLVAGAGTRLDTIDSSGAVIASSTGLAAGPYSFARFASPGNEFMYAGNQSNPLLRWNGASWTAGTTLATVNGTASSAMPRPGAVAVTAAVPGSSSGTNAANRLVATAFGTLPTGGPGGTASNPSRVYFSNPGLPETWETDGTSGRGRNFVDLTPGDGEQIMAAVTWRELVFIFKETKFFVLWGESTAADGTPVFNFREVVNNIGLAGRLAVAVGRDGVYFLNRTGIYRTNGGDPQLLSDKISPLWTGDPEVYYQGDPINFAQLPLARLAWTDERLYAAVPTGTRTYNDRLLAYDTRHDWWSVHDVAASALATFRRVDQDELHHGYATGPLRVGHRSTGANFDRGTTPIAWRWRAGWGDYNIPAEKTFRETKVWGTGAVMVSFSTDYNEGQTSSESAIFGVDALWPLTGTWAAWIAASNGTWPGGGQVSSALLRIATRGTAFSTQFSNHPSFTYGSIHRVAKHLREVRQPSAIA